MKDGMRFAIDSKPVVRDYLDYSTDTDHRKSETPGEAG